MKRVVIIGGGFAGVYTAKQLVGTCEVTLISDHNFFLFTPMLHEVATGGISRDNIIQPIHHYISDPSFRFVKEKALKIDTKKKLVVTKECKISYDTLVIATGSSANYFGITGAEKYSIPLRTVHDAYKIKNTVIQNIERARITSNSKKRKELLTFSIAGGGATGVELAAELAEFAYEMTRECHMQKSELTIQLIHRGSTILNMLPEYYRKRCQKRLEKLGVKLLLECEVKKVGTNFIIDQNKKKVFSGTLFWAVGFRPNTIPLDTQPVKIYEVDEYLKVKGYNDIFALGDCAYIALGKGRVPMLAQFAVKQSRFVAQNIIYPFTPKPYVHKSDGFLLSVGQYFAVAGIGKGYFSGFFAWWVWRTIYLSKLLGVGNKIRVAVDWTLKLFFSRDTSEV